jgi:hypothetical protein
MLFTTELTFADFFLPLPAFLVSSSFFLHRKLLVDEQIIANNKAAILSMVG